MMGRIAIPLGGIARVLRAILGVPDYERYLVHMRASRTGHPALTREEFVRDRADNRYNRPGSRCC